MSLFDSLRFEGNLPDDSGLREFQTQSLGCLLDMRRITPELPRLPGATGADEEARILRDRHVLSMVDEGTACIGHLLDALRTALVAATP